MSSKTILISLIASLTMFIKSPSLNFLTNSWTSWCMILRIQIYHRRFKKNKDKLWITWLINWVPKMKMKTTLTPQQYSQICWKSKIFTTKFARRTIFRNFWTLFTIKKIKKINKVKTQLWRFLTYWSNTSMTSTRRTLTREIKTPMKMMILIWELLAIMKMKLLMYLF